METTYRVGTSGWNYSSWKHNFYPDNIPQAKWLEYYTQFFDTVELNATFYRFFKEENFQKWHQRTPHNFKFVIKTPGYITHRKQLLDATSQLESFRQNTKALKQKLGLILLQLSPRTPYDLERLEEKLIEFGSDTKKLVVEFRNEKWLTDDSIKLLKSYHAIYCNIDSPTIRLQTILTAKIAYIRLHGRTKMYVYDYNDRELEEVAKQARKLHQMGAKTVYIFFNNDVNANAVRNALTLKKILGDQ